MKKKILHYDAVFEKESDGGYSVWVPDLPGCASQGDTLEEAIGNIKEAAELYLEDADEEKIEEGKTHKDRFIVPVRVTTQ
ncbi:MAG: type II toxin-antitoxin system HicB family antitoxin [Candidatus Levybacteria bacterium]|nr:type II toxin-antitoxin system HicB family antitoxin [Candidatus Levybacteria bacterium]